MLAYSPKIERYRHFNVIKKSGNGVRTISSPRRDLKEVQRAIAKELSTQYKVPDCTHGFIEGKSVTSNASMHTRKKFILNIDLLDFFPSISSSRIRGFFSKTLDFPADMADILTNLVCDNGSLPQGAPTSPVLSNLICHPMDKALIAFASRNRITYTRYADDLVFSSTSRYKSRLLYNQETSGLDAVAQDIKSIIAKNGFKINVAKIHIANCGSRQTVNGIIVNKKCNFPRSEYRALRVTFHQWKNKGLNQAAFAYAQHYPKYKARFFDDDTLINDCFIRHIRGRLTYYSMITSSNRSESAPLSKLWTMFYLCTKEKVPSLDHSYQTFKIEGPRDDECSDELLRLSETGSFFYIHPWIITCAHCIANTLVSDQQKYDLFFKQIENLPNIEIAQEEIHSVGAMDFAYMELNDERLAPFSLTPDFSYRVQTGEEVIAAGFPDGRSTPDIVIASVVNQATLENYVRVDRAFIKGMSGGPVFNKWHKVIGIVVKGSDINQYEKNGEFIPLHLLKDFEPFVRMLKTRAPSTIQDKSNETSSRPSRMPEKHR